MGGRGQTEEIRIHNLVEHVRLKPVEHLGNAGNDDGSGSEFCYIVRQQREIFDVIEMQVRQQDMLDAELLLQCQLGTNRSGVQKQDIIDEKTARMARPQILGICDQLIRSMTP